MKFYDLTVPQLIRVLGNIDRWLDRAAAHAQADQFLTARLAPDQFALTRQVQVSTDNAKLMCARLTGKQAPSHPDTETTYAQLKTRIAAVSEHLRSYTAEDFADAHDRKITMPWMQPGQWLSAEDYLVQFALPNFYFHVVTTYSILRHMGLELGKNDFLGTLSIHT